MLTAHARICGLGEGCNAETERNRKDNAKERQRNSVRAYRARRHTRRFDDTKPLPGITGFEVLSDRRLAFERAQLLVLQEQKLTLVLESIVFTFYLRRLRSEQLELPDSAGKFIAQAGQVRNFLASGVDSRCKLDVSRVVRSYRSGGSGAADAGKLLFKGLNASCETDD